jgi:divalent metal cation (Fe/Co/Zn/Cd) transporter
LILCGTYSLEIFCLGVFLAFAGYFVLVESRAGIVLHFVVAIIGILIMTAVAWLNTWYKRADASSAPRIGGNIANADIVGG